MLIACQRTSARRKGNLILGERKTIKWKKKKKCKKARSRQATRPFERELFARRENWSREFGGKKKWLREKESRRDRKEGKKVRGEERNGGREVEREGGREEEEEDFLSLFYFDCFPPGFPKMNSNFIFSTETFEFQIKNSSECCLLSNTCLRTIENSFSFFVFCFVALKKLSFAFPFEIIRSLSAFWANLKFCLFWRKNQKLSCSVEKNFYYHYSSLNNFK